MFNYDQEYTGIKEVESTTKKMTVVTVLLSSSKEEEKLFYYDSRMVPNTEGYYNTHRIRAVKSVLPVSVGQEIKTDTYETVTVLLVEEKPLIERVRTTLTKKTSSIHKSMLPKYAKVFCGIQTHGSWNRAEKTVEAAKEMGGEILKNKKNHRGTWCEIVFSISGKKFSFESFPSCENIAFFASKKEALRFSKLAKKAFSTK